MGIPQKRNMTDMQTETYYSLCTLFGPITHNQYPSFMHAHFNWPTHLCSLVSRGRWKLGSIGRNVTRKDRILVTDKVFLYFPSSDIPYLQRKTQKLTLQNILYYWTKSARRQTYKTRALAQLWFDLFTCPFYYKSSCTQSRYRWLQYTYNKHEKTNVNM